ncbi:MAG: fasciclin domain-containing protein [Polyangiales bacterium]
MRPNLRPARTPVLLALLLASPTACRSTPQRWTAPPDSATGEDEAQVAASKRKAGDKTSTRPPQQRPKERSCTSIFTVLRETPAFSGFRAELEGCGLLEALAKQTPLTVFAPMDGPLPKASAETATADAPAARKESPDARGQSPDARKSETSPAPDARCSLMRHHFLKGSHAADSFLSKALSVTLAGKGVAIRSVAGRVHAAGARSLGRSWRCQDGYVHPMNHHLSPAGADAPAERQASPQAGETTSTQPPKKQQRRRQSGASPR